MLRKRLVTTALSEFRQHGYAGTSIEGIARAAGVSRTTVYALYNDKRTLFTEMIRTTIVTSDISRWVAFDDREPEVVLREVSVALHRAYYREPNLEVIRLCIAEADRFPDLVEQARMSLGVTLTGLADYFDRLHAAGRLTIPDGRCGALLFNMLSLGSLKPFFINQARLSAQDRSGHIDMALQIFLNGALVRASGNPAT